MSEKLQQLGFDRRAYASQCQLSIVTQAIDILRDSTGKSITYITQGYGDKLSKLETCVEHQLSSSGLRLALPVGIRFGPKLVTGISSVKNASLFASSTIVTR